MWPLNYFRKSTHEQKSNIRNIDLSIDEYFNDPVNVLLSIPTGAPTTISAREAYFMSERNSDLGTAVSMISDSISQLTIMVGNKDKEVRRSDPIIDIFNNPGGTMRNTQFMYDISEAFLLTNEIYIVGRGNINRPPLELIPIRPYNVSVTMNELDGIPDKIETQCTKDRRMYCRETIDRKIRFIDKTGLNEIFPIIGVSNLSDEWRGRSKLVKLIYDVDMNTDGKRHNTALLKNGMNRSGIITPKGIGSGGALNSWSDKIVSKLTKYIRSFNQGAGNAGNTMILSEQADFTNITQSNTDMDFLNLLGVSRESIYNAYKVPLPLVLSDTMTLDNYTSAQRSYYTRAVFPVFENIAGGLIHALSPRFKSIESTDKLVFSEVDIRDMRPVLVENMVKLKETEAVTTNETRSVGGYEPNEYGDSILVSSNKIPLEAIDVGPSFEDIEEEIDDESSTEENVDPLEEESREET